MGHAILPIVVHTFLIKDNKVFLIRRANTSFMDGTWFGAAGRLDENEKIVDGAIRETKEEIGIDLRKENLSKPLVMHFKDHTGKIRISFFFYVKNFDGEPKNNEPDKASEAQWFSIDNLSEDTAPHVKLALEKILKGETFIEYGF
ncbi:NUDIX domain-containing protein [Candidatus Gracilibacteria bacterium]|nr:NUDIX domain-containing protein [Candidatus Gracilibacteria bacterium]